MGRKYTLTNRYHGGYANLAAAILTSGINQNDILFLESDWAANLRELCRLDDVIYGDRSVRATRGVVECVRV